MFLLLRNQKYLKFRTKPTTTKKLPKGADAVENRIRELRRQQKVTQDELAKAVGVTRQTIISLEGGKYVASLGLAHKLAVFFGVTIEDIFIFD